MTAAPDQLDLFGAPEQAPSAPLVEPSPVVIRRPALPPPTGAYLTCKELGARGWTRAAIRRFLGAPEVQAVRSRGGWDYIEHRYDSARVLRAEASAAFVEWRAARDARSAAVLRGLERAVAEAAAWAPMVARMSIARLRGLAVAHYNDRLMTRMERRQDWSGRLASLDSEPVFLERLCVNYLRHCMTSYDELLNRLRKLGRRGDEAVGVVQRHALEAIRAAYPELAGECARQVGRKGLAQVV